MEANFPPNSRASKERTSAPREPRKRVTEADVVRRKPSLGKKFAQTFIGGDARTAWDYMIFDVGIPEARDVIVNVLQGGIERFFTGGVTRGRPSPYNPLGRIDYGAYSRGPQRDDRPPLPTQRQLSRQARARHDFDEIILQTRGDAEEVLSSMREILDSQYEVVTVADLYELVGTEPTHVDTTWGWTNLKGAGVARVRGLGYLLDLPEPEHFR